MSTGRVAHALAALAAALLVAGCGEQVGTATGDVDLEGSWHLVSGRDADGVFDLAGRKVTLKVEGEEAGGTSACNLYGARVAVDGDDVTLSELGGTEMACEPDVMALEQRYLEALGAVERGERGDDVLRLSGPGVTLELSLDPPVEDAALVGTTWLLESLIDGDSVSSVAEQGDLRFLDGGVMVATVGCGTQRARYVLDGDDVALTDFTDRDPDAGTCPPDAEAQHAHAVDVLRDGFTAHVEGDRLTLMNQQGKGLDFRAG
ncbi:MAG TPA: META domain-containing protein [Nocardioidaceae bacterium]|nr:META domain-containing protein [Nocardioidaceae bacterium]